MLLLISSLLSFSITYILARSMMENRSKNRSMVYDIFPLYSRNHKTNLKWPKTVSLFSLVYGLKIKHDYKSSEFIRKIKY